MRQEIAGMMIDDWVAHHERVQLFGNGDGQNDIVFGKTGSGAGCSEG